MTFEARPARIECRPSIGECGKALVYRNEEKMHASISKVLEQVYHAGLSNRHLCFLSLFVVLLLSHSSTPSSNPYQLARSFDLNSYRLHTTILEVIVVGIAEASVVVRVDTLLVPLFAHDEILAIWCQALPVVRR